ncbi:hypothetical protein BC827DRAFT_1154841 [Russula dissimulans]|nr:hypothetical protein BC827DRAFT_1154841 [Russula dissimulans]
MHVTPARQPPSSEGGSFGRSGSPVSRDSECVHESTMGQQSKQSHFSSLLLGTPFYQETMQTGGTPAAQNLLSGTRNCMKPSESVSDKTIAVIDGSSLLAHPAGINREELELVPVEHFNKSKLSKDGYLVRIEDQDVKLPSSDSESFWMARTSIMRHTCVSRLIYLSLAEEAVNISNVAGLVDSEGKPHFKYIVEGVNLFFTQQKCKVVIFKDSSANKGTVTSSLLEVLAGLTLLMEESVDLMPLDLPPSLLFPPSKPTTR